MPFERVGAFRSPNETLGLGKDTEWAPSNGVTYGDSRSELDTESELDTSDAAKNETDTTFSEPLLDYASFSVRVAERDIEKMDVILKRFTDSEIRDLQRGVENVRGCSRTTYPSSPRADPHDGPPRRAAVRRRRIGKGSEKGTTFLVKIKTPPSSRGWRAAAPRTSPSRGSGAGVWVCSPACRGTRSR
mmetsp:Transcript_13820/g.58102  ORF Transcript_13820/g.58102 Transcript_13820/m.58102 type:complete len:188 (+) Transcript_13820:3-566(+)